MTPSVRYPAGPVVPHAAYHILAGDIPMVALRSYDDSVVFHLMGGMAIPDRTMPESVQIMGLKGLVPPWKTIDQKGATQDGVSFVDALYDPVEVTANVRAHGRDPQYTRQVVRDLIASLDVKQQSELSWFTQELGRWWAPVRWFKTPPDPISNTRLNRQDLTLVMRADNGFWRSYDCTDIFRFVYQATGATDTFTTDYPSDLGSGWTIGYSSGGSGIIYTQNGQVNSTLTGKAAVARKVGYTSSNDEMVAEIALGTLPSWFFDINAFDEIWLRMANTGTPGQDGVRLRFGWGYVAVSAIVAGVETILRQQPLLIPPLPGDTFTLVAGFDGDPRRFKVLRNGTPVPFMDITETGTTSQLGSGFRSAGLGMYSQFGEAPAGIRSWSSGVNTVSTQTGYVTLTNVGDQPMFYRLTCIGPGTFKFWNGPAAGANEFVTFGRINAGQIVQIRTDPRKRGVVDLTSTPTTPEQQAQFTGGLGDLLSFAPLGLLTDLLSVVQSIFGILGQGAPPPQGNLYSLLKGRFSDAAAIPAKSPGKPAQPYQVKVEIDGGTADSAILAAGTPLRRWPT